MSDQFGLLDLPVPVPEQGQAIGDPLLDMLLDFMRCVINDETGKAWAKVAPVDPLPVKFVFAESPNLENFNTNDTPALYAWRGADKGSHRYSQDLVSDEAPISCLWVPPPADQESRRLRQPMRNPIKKALKAAFAQGRHPSWIVPDDDYFNPETFGSVLLVQTRCSKLHLGEFRDHELIIDHVDRSGGKTSFDCLFFAVDCLELLVRDPLARAGSTEHISGKMTINIGRDPDNLLTVLQAEFRVSLTSVSPATGSAAGGDVVTVTGSQFEDGMTVLFGTVVATDVELVDESTLSVTTPAHAAGVVSITVRTTSSEATLAAAFTFT